MRKKYSILKGVKTSDFGIDPYLTMNDPAILIQEISSFKEVEIETSRDLVSNPTVQNMDLEDMMNMQFKEYIKQNQDYILSLPNEVRTLIYEKAKIKPYKKSVAKFREIMTQPLAPPTKLFML